MISLPKDGWRNELTRERSLSAAARDLLDKIIVHHENHAPGISVTKETMEIAKKELTEGVRIGGHQFEINVFVPNVNEHVTGRTVFILVEKHLGGKIRLLSEVQIEV